jgi:hypothetical protein
VVGYVEKERPQNRVLRHTGYYWKRQGERARKTNPRSSIIGMGKSRRMRGGTRCTHGEVEESIQNY